MSTAKITFNEKAKAYYELAKPGIIYGNLLTAAAGFLFASQWKSGWGTLLFMLVGLGLIIGCGCAINNATDKEIDSLMDRTKKRAIVSGQIKSESALIYAGILGALGALILGLLTNYTALLVALFGLFVYVGPYGLSKRKTPYSTIIGSLSGAVPPLVGYTAFSNSVDAPGIIIVCLLICWQMTHFAAISLYRKKEYKAAGLPIWSVVHGDWSTQLQAVGFIGLFTIFGVGLFIFGYVGYLFLLGIMITGLGWLWYSVVQTNKLPPGAWGKKVFLSSLIVIMATSLLLAVGPILA